MASLLLSFSHPHYIYGLRNTHFAACATDQPTLGASIVKKKNSFMSLTWSSDDPCFQQPHTGDSAPSKCMLFKSIFTDCCIDVVRVRSSKFYADDSIDFLRRLWGMPIGFNFEPAVYHSLTALQVNCLIWRDWQRFAPNQVAIRSFFHRGHCICECLARLETGRLLIVLSNLASGDALALLMQL